MTAYNEPDLVKRLTDIVSVSADIRTLCESFTDELEKSVQVDWARVFLTADEKSDNFSGESNQKKSPLKYAPRHDIFVYAKTVVENEPSRATCRQLGCPLETASIIWLPLVIISDVVGVMVVASRTLYTNNRKQLPSLQYLSGMLSLAIQVKMLQQEKKTTKQQDFEWVNFVDLLVHELKTSLTTVVSSSGLLQEKTARGADEMQKRIIQNLGDSLGHLESIISELPTLVRARRKTERAPADYCAPGLVLREVLAYMRPASDRRGQILVLDAPESMPQVAIGQNRLKQVLLHLLSNAVESTPEKGEIILRAGVGEDSIIIEVTDGGPVIPEEKRRELFEPSQWGDVDSQWIPRLRFRVAVAKILIEACGGRLWLDSQEGQGNIFAFSLPVIDVSSLNHTVGK